MEVHAHTLTARKKWTHYFQVKIIHYKNIKLSDPLHPVHSDISVSPGAKLITGDPELLTLYSNRRQFTLTVLNIYILNMKLVYSKAINLVSFIKKEYHLE